MNPAQQNLPSVATSEPQRAGNFLIAVYEALLSRPVSLDSPEGRQHAQQLLVLGDRVAGRYETFAPELAQPVRGFLAHLRGQLSPQSATSALGETVGSAPAGQDTKRLTGEEIYEQRISELEDSAGREQNVTFKNVAYAKAALAVKPEDYQRAKRIADKIDDNDLRADTVSFVLYRAALFFVERAEIEKAAEIVPQIGDISRRAVVQIAIAQRLLASNSGNTGSGLSRLEQQRAFDLLTDVERDLKKAEPSSNVAKILLARAAFLTKLDRAQALAALRQAIQVINKLDGFDLRDAAAPDLGLRVFASSGATVARLRSGFDLRSAIEPLIVTDFEEVSAIVEGLPAKEVNGVGRLEVAKLFLKQSASPAGSDLIRGRAALSTGHEEKK
jgi:tetratricopeptide (TPR) repeat protein